MNQRRRGMMRALILSSAAVASLAASALAASPPPFVPLRLDQVTRDAKSDPLSIWTKAEMADDPRGASLYVGRHRASNGSTVLISQMVSIGCGSPSNCPVRVVVEATDGKRRTVLNGEQMCASPAHFAIRADLTALRACDLTAPLRR